MTLVNVTIADNIVTGTVASSGGGLSLTTGGKAGLYNTHRRPEHAGTGAVCPGQRHRRLGGGSLVPNSAFNLIGTGGAGGLVAGGNTSNLVGVANPGLATTTRDSAAASPRRSRCSRAARPSTRAAQRSSAWPCRTSTSAAHFAGRRDLNAGSTVDIGAYEATSSYLVSTTADTPDVGTIATAVGWANVSTNVNPANIAHPAPNTIVFDQGDRRLRNAANDHTDGGPLATHQYKHRRGGRRPGYRCAHDQRRQLGRRVHGRQPA